MAFTKTHFYAGMILIFALLSFSVMKLGNTFVSDPDTVVNNESKDYVSDYAGYIKDGNMEKFKNEEIDEKKQANYLTSGNETGEQSVTDYLGQLNFYKERIKPIVDTLRLVFNIPTFLIRGLGLPIGAFGWVINIFGVVLEILFIRYIIRLLRGT